MESSTNFDLAGISMLVVIMAGVLALRLGINLRDAWLMILAFKRSLRYKQVNWSKFLTVSVARKLAHSRKKKKDIDRSIKGKSSFKTVRLDKATIARNLQLQEQNKELLYSSIALLMKLGLLAIVAGSFVRLGMASHRRITRNNIRYIEFIYKYW